MHKKRVKIFLGVGILFIVGVTIAIFRYGNPKNSTPLNSYASSEIPLNRGTEITKSLHSTSLMPSLLDKNEKKEDDNSEKNQERSLIDQKIVDCISRMDEGDVEGGLKDLIALHQEYPENETIMEELGMYYNDQEKWDLAYPFLMKLFKLNPNNSVGINELSHLMAQRDGRPVALKFLQEQREKFPESLGIMSSLAEFYAQEEKFDQAMPIMEEIVKKTGGSIYELETISNVYTDQGNQDKAIEYLVRAQKKIESSAANPTSLSDEDKMTYNRVTLSLASNYIKLGTSESCKSADGAIKSLHPMPFEMSAVLTVNEEFEKNCSKK